MSSGFLLVFVGFATQTNLIYLRISKLKSSKNSMILSFSSLFNKQSLTNYLLNITKLKIDNYQKMQIGCGKCPTQFAGYLTHILFTYSFGIPRVHTFF